MKLAKNVCENCKHLFISGMLQSWGGTSGYCLLNSNKKEIPEKQRRPIKNIMDTCSEFKNK